MSLSRASHRTVSRLSVWCVDSVIKLKENVRTDIGRTKFRCGFQNIDLYLNPFVSFCLRECNRHNWSPHCTLVSCPLCSSVYSFPRRLDHTELCVSCYLWLLVIHMRQGSYICTNCVELNVVVTVKLLYLPPALTITRFALFMHCEFRATVLLLPLNSVSALFFVIETHWVFCEVGTDCMCIYQLFRCTSGLIWLCTVIYKEYVYNRVNFLNINFYPAQIF